MDKLQKVKEFLLKRRNLDKAKMEKRATEEDGFFDVDSYAGGNIDDAYLMGKDNGEAELIEEILILIE